MNNIEKVMMVMLGASVSVGCSAQGSPPASGGGGAIEDTVVRSGEVVLIPGRSHDISNADLDGTVQFRVVSAPAGDLTRWIDAAICYKASKGAAIGARGEVSAIKATNALILTVRAAEPLAVNESYTLAVAPGKGVAVSDAERTGPDGLWRMQIYTGSKPQLVAVRKDGARVTISFSEPVDLRDLNLSLASRGQRIRGCFETGLGCVDRMDASEMTEEVSFKLADGAVSDDLELSMTAPNSSSVASLQLQQGSWATALDGSRSWHRSMAD